MAENSKPVFVKVSSSSKGNFHLIRLDKIAYVTKDTDTHSSTIRLEAYINGKIEMCKLYSSDTVTEIESKILNALS